MRLNSLKFCAFGPYKEKQTINFEKFKQDGLFLITGPTGAGKTSIFDAISFVLYGEVSGQRKETKTLKSDFAGYKEVCFVELEFEVKGKKYKIKRVPQQLVEKKNQPGLKLQVQKAELVLPNGKIKTNLKDVYNIITNEILGVDKENFNKLVMLPQGMFQKLLQEKGSEQVNTFRKLFKTEIFETVANKIFEQKQLLKKEYDIKIEENLKKIEFYELEEEDLKKTKDLDFSKRLDFLKEHSEKEKQRLKELEKELKILNSNLKEVELKLELKRSLKKKEEEKNKLLEKKQSLSLKVKNKQEFNKKKFLLNKIENLKIYYAVWQEKKNQLLNKNLNLNKLEKELNFLKLKSKNVLEEFKKIPELEEKRESILKKQNNILVMFNNFEFAEKIGLKIKQLEEQKQKLLNKTKILKEKLEFKTNYLKFKEKEKQNNELKELIDIYKKIIEFKNNLKGLNEEYLKKCRDFYEQQAFRLAKNLKKGQMCPVCGSVNHPNPKVLTSLKIVSENQLEQIRKQIFNLKDKLNFFLVEVNSKKKELEKEFKNLEELKSFFKESLKEQQSLKNILEQFKKQNKENFNLNVKTDYELELLNLNLELEKKMANLLELKTQQQNFLQKIPKNLQKKEELQNYKKQILKENIALEEKINLIKTKKEEQEKEIKELGLKKENLNQVILELTQQEEKAKTEFLQKLEKTGNTLEEILKIFDDFKELKNFVENFELCLKELEKISFKLSGLEKDLKGFKNNSLEEILKKQKQLNLKIDELKKEEKALIKRVAVNASCLKEITLNLSAIKKLEDEFKIAKILSDVAKGNKKRVSFEKFVLTSCLNEVLVYSNDWLKKATANRYSFSVLKSQDCLNFNVFDSYSGKIRHVSTLSGGETFAASLALCLGLCSRISSMFGGVEFNTMLIDEGFATLDSSYLDSVIFCLNNLLKAGRQIGLISHLEDLKSRIKSKIVVKKNLKGGSRISLKLN